MFAQRSKSDQTDLFVEEGIENPLWQERLQPTAVAQPKPITSQVRHRHDWIAGVTTAFCDVVCWVLLYGFVGYVRRDAFFVGPFEFVLVDCVSLLVLLQALYIVGGYNRNTETRGLTYTAEHVLAVTAAAIISSLLIYSAAAYQGDMKPSRGVLLISFVLFVPISLLYRRFFRRAVVASAAQRAFLVVGSGELAKQFYNAYKHSPNQQQLEFVDNDSTRVGSTIAGDGSPVIQGDIAAKLANLDPRYNGVILAESVDRLGQDLIERLVRTQFQRTRVYTLESFYEAHWRHVPMHTIDPFWPLQMGFQLACISPYNYLKRLFDLVASAVLLILSSPIIVIAWLLVRLTSNGPAIFGQVRVGREGQKFTAYKFRTMQMNGVEGADGEIYTREDDPRITAVGKWLRKLRFDELPQLWNVLKGDMSLIGPRAEWDKCVERYENRIPFYHFRHLVKPGITGWAQVNYPYGESEEDALNKLQYDLYYIRHYSLKLDAMIALKTVHIMLFGKGR
jgi:exopolysaccharide biosynthesis polyprenyl glycosylphosphotransferase